MTNRGQKLAALTIVAALVAASFGYATTGSYFNDAEDGNITIEMPESPVGNATNSSPVDEGSPVNVTAAGSTDDRGIVSYGWDFDSDGAIEAMGMNQSHTFMDQGDYGVRIVVTDTAGLTDTATTTVTVENVPPTARAGSDRAVYVDDLVAFDASNSTDPGADDLTYQWDLDGDGTYDEQGVDIGHRYRSEGIYDVTLRVSDGDGGVDTDKRSVVVQNVPPTADAGTALTVVTGEPTLDGSGSSRGDSSDTLTYRWDVDDDGDYETRGAKPGYYYNETGTYNVTLTLSDGDGGVDIDDTTVTVEPDTVPPVAAFGLDRANVNDKSITFDASKSTDNARIVDYEWDLGDGTTTAGETISHVYDDPGEYNVELTVTDSAGYEDTTNKTIVIENEPPIADAGESQTIVAGIPATLDATGSSEGDVSDTLTYRWDVDDDGDYETRGAKPGYYYNETGTYNVTLTLSDGDGGVDTDNTTVIVEPDTEPPTADAGGDRTATAGESLQFDATGSTDNVGIVSYEWTFGDRATASGPIANHTYSDEGTYSATLTVRDDAGNVGDVTTTVTVESAAPVANSGSNKTVSSDGTVTPD
ncbi:Secreted protein, with PKD repeat domain [Halapricum desulfuricans]|uniref:Secreted protein, with PKD repeat domain n=1 Tax=Halapricum desulfuricans TaxID=2841257 RepID=A0A897NNE2_9EURY|nr:PKD domain-containing protein [Halapricum desulfuricans]QSG11736.1 Secreted protein, with PKD repeat domain [Halapricum desulfuricans]